jgi:hypothetical protein
MAGVVPPQSSVALEQTRQNFGRPLPPLGQLFRREYKLKCTLGSVARQSHFQRE